MGWQQQGDRAWTQATDQLRREIKLRAQVLASPAYQERCNLLFDLFRASRKVGRNPQDILAIQVELAELLMHLQKKKAEFKQANNDLGFTVARRLILILKRIADSLAWRLLGYDRVLVHLISEHSETGHLDATVAGDFAEAQQIVEQEDAIVLINDLTTILRHGDLIIIDKDGIALMERKYGKASKRNRRAKRQRRRLNELLEFLNAGVRVKEDRRDFILKADVPINTHHSTVTEAISWARAQGYHRIDVSDVLVIEAVWTKGLSGMFPEKRPFENGEHIAWFHSLQGFDKPTSRLAPYGIFPLDDQDCYDLITGDIILVTILNFDNLRSLYGQYGLQFDLPQPSQQEIEAYVSAPIVERKKMRMDRFVIKSDNSRVSLTPDLFGRIGQELIHAETVVQADRQLMDLVKDLHISDEKISEFYVGYKDESSVWV